MKINTYKYIEIDDEEYDELNNMVEGHIDEINKILPKFEWSERSDRFEEKLIKTIKIINMVNSLLPYYEQLLKKVEKINE